MLLAIDPGGTTGYAVRFNSGSTVTSTTTDPEQVWGLVRDAGRSAGSTVIIERFATAGMLSRYGLHTIELVGGVRALCWAYSIKLVERQPQQRKAWQKQAEELLRAQRRKRGGCTDGRTYMIHEEDALAHLLAWASTHS